MKFLGVEFKDFACFDRQFVPIREGVTLLVGRNNAGKTALLRGLSTLGALPVGELRAIPTDLTGYTHNPANRRFSLDLIFGLEQEEHAYYEPMFDSMTPESWDNVFRNGISRWRFSVAAKSNQVAFDKCIFVPRSSQTEYEVIGRNGGNVYVRRRHFPDMTAFVNVSVPAGSFQEEGVGSSPTFNEGNRFTAPLEGFHNVKLVSAHRVVAPRQTLQSASSLPGDAQSLAQFLMTLQGRDRDTFEAIEKFVTKVFPEFRHVNASASDNNEVGITFTERLSNRRIPLENCGTGVEQILALTTFVLTTPRPGILLLDEPHSYLHPTAERALVQFLAEHPDHRYVISTHSAVLMNSVEPDRIINVSHPGHAYPLSQGAPETAKILFDLGYRNSDALFNDRLIFVEGPSDEEIIPILLLNDGELDQAEISRTGFPVLDGVGKGTRALQTSILRYEKLLAATSRGDQPRMYLFDGDRTSDERGVLRGTTSPVTNTLISTNFLLRPEIENYLLVPEAIATALKEELILVGEQREITADEVQTAMNELLASDDNNLFPNGKRDGVDPVLDAKGSRVLDRLYDRFALPYNKTKSGPLIAKRITIKNQASLSEITELVRSVFRQV